MCGQNKHPFVATPGIRYMVLSAKCLKGYADMLQRRFFYKRKVGDNDLYDLSRRTQQVQSSLNRRVGA